MARVVLTIEGLDEFRQDVSNAGSKLRSNVRWAMVQSVNIVKNSAQQLAPYKTGTLRRSIYTDVQQSGFRGVIAQDSAIASYGAHIEYGTKAHTISAINKKALFWKGAMHPVRSVRHPGFRGKPYMLPALEQNVNLIKDYFSEALRRTVVAIAKGGA